MLGRFISPCVLPFVLVFFTCEVILNKYVYKSSGISLLMAIWLILVNNIYNYLIILSGRRGCLQFCTGEKKGRGVGVTNVNFEHAF